MDIDKTRQDWLFDISVVAYLFCLGEISESVLDKFIANEIPEYLWAELYDAGQEKLFESLDKGDC